MYASPNQYLLLDPATPAALRSRIAAGAFLLLLDAAPPRPPAFAMTRSAHHYRERAGLIPTRRRPAPRFVPDLNRAHTTPLAPPRPLPIYARFDQGGPAPDRDLTVVWPHGTQSEQPQ